MPNNVARTVVSSSRDILRTQIAVACDINDERNETPDHVSTNTTSKQAIVPQTPRSEDKGGEMGLAGDDRAEA